MQIKAKLSSAPSASKYVIGLLRPRYGSGADNLLYHSTVMYVVCFSLKMPHKKMLCVIVLVQKMVCFFHNSHINSFIKLRLDNPVNV